MLMLRRIFASHDVKQPFSSLSSNATLLLSLQTAAIVPAAPCGGRVASILFASTPNEGWMERRQAHSSFGRACDARPPCPGATGTSLGAPPWRFSDADPRSRLPAVEPEPQRLPAPSHQCLAVGVRTSRGAVRAAVAGRHSSLRLQDRLRKTPPAEPGCKSLYYKFVT